GSRHRGPPGASEAAGSSLDALGRVLAARCASPRQQPERQQPIRAIVPNDGTKRKARHPQRFAGPRPHATDRPRPLVRHRSPATAPGIR
ncbi:hypothetical protein, partial [Burkholderia multivorans]|uniref:hypothetical protein n=1 Tax=Burkholderia multivorans TaxID=87883 RepID=UPI001C6595F0